MTQYYTSSCITVSLLFTNCIDTESTIAQNCDYIRSGAQTQSDIPDGFQYHVRNAFIKLVDFVSHELLKSEGSNPLLWFVQCDLIVIWSVYNYCCLTGHGDAWHN